ncbi:monofunctional biosynthetic peptidoglycan transglycosylase [Dyella psychrodurans]|uniref:Biosynthetic peptidoglycan transglycosylase n=1 Tax=Dyella psychrodurans TaxID=1927960 RepID=A0A370X588_9GAMM|nr:monofunctional biosynthetic peptidoglycan transglycosylase [Dyella psychrodurans]RDS83440.1 monofunctional biosynthetic peptidoglycan transglycosylase [Dyella psychrodurans]
MAHLLPFHRWLRYAGIVALSWVALTWLVVLVLRFVPPWTSAVMMERQVDALIHGEKGFHLQHHWVPWSRVSPWVPIAMVAGEDQKFPFHHGFDFDSIQNAIDAADDGRRLRGASTISQQTAKNLFLWNGRSFVRKGLEAYFTVLIELTWPKRRILEVYMNIAQLGDGIYGVGAASENFFHASPDRLGPAQAARLAAVLPNPDRFHVDRPSGYVMERSRWIEEQMDQLGGPGYLESRQPPRDAHIGRRR